MNEQPIPENEQKIWKLHQRRWTNKTTWDTVIPLQRWLELKSDHTKCLQGSEGARGLYTAPNKKKAPNEKP